MSLTFAEPLESNTYPMIPDLEDVVPEPTTQEVPIPHGTKLPPSTLQMDRWLGGASPTFDTNPHCFTIPGHTMADAFDFAAAMQDTVQWTLENLATMYLAPLNSCKAKSGQKCGCQARFNILLHLATNSLRVDWFWKHSHKLNTLKDMENTRISKATHDWVCACVDSGLGWDSIQDLLSSQDLDVLCKTTAPVPEANGVT
ncbi:hypothetical protein PTTG_27558 [Puccinia triticina 1-1 BBBD Race 1]|uniref:Uncharacterized protein n=1 Tax=Puccinia triticina (isolate 1-1 / race 1 (BBBD)) TaxID=630390 RepID=A0A180GIX3_PUCT1|nr:hypothetical protein PTTG_27558 [Puccinia triticina 1-1 BBBD Race 1]